MNYSLPPKISESSSDAKDVESVVLVGTAAIQRLIAERNKFSAMNDDLRSQINLIGSSYIKLAAEFVTQLQRLNDTIQNLVGERSEVQAPPYNASAMKPISYAEPSVHPVQNGVTAPDI